MLAGIACAAPFPAAGAALNRGVELFADDALARYGFPTGHPFGIDRQSAFLSALAGWFLVQPRHGAEGR